VSLENFKKQAKLLVRWHRERNYSVGGRIRQLSRYEDLTDSEALGLPFPLNEAQEIIALEQGCNSWAELKEGLKKAPKTIRRATVALKLTKAIPVLYGSDVQAATDFYRDNLGFTIDFLHGQPTFYASVSRDEACIHLRLGKWRRRHVGGLDLVRRLPRRVRRLFRLAAGINTIYKVHLERS